MDKDELELILALRAMAFLEALEMQAEILWVSHEQIYLEDNKDFHISVTVQWIKLFKLIVSKSTFWMGIFEHYGVVEIWSCDRNQMNMNPVKKQTNKKEKAERELSDKPEVIPASILFFTWNPSSQIS